MFGVGGVEEQGIWNILVEVIMEEHMECVTGHALRLLDFGDGLKVVAQAIHVCY
jgi:hypothetical protein